MLTNLGAGWLARRAQGAIARAKGSRTIFARILRPACARTCADSKNARKSIRARILGVCALLRAG